VALQFEARKIALKQDRTGFILSLSLHPDEIPEELIRDFVGARYACALVRIQDDESPTPYKNRVQRAGMICKDPKFQTFMMVTNEMAAAEELCKRCGIESRTELHGNRLAQAAFDEIIEAFEREKDDF
jgi:hypothetical protein